MTGTPALRAQDAGGILITHGVHGLDGRTDEFDFAAFADLGKVGVLGQETVSGMNGVHVPDFRRAQDPIDLQITFRARGRPDTNCFIRQLDVKGVDVGFRINRQGPNPEFLASPDDPQSNLAAVSDQDFFKHFSGASLPLANQVKRKLEARATFSEL